MTTSNQEMTDQQVRDMIKRHEGFRSRVYIDSVGIPTVGWGHAFLVDSPVDRAICEMLFEKDYQTAVDDYEEICYDYNLDLDSVRRGVIIDMLFNLGKTKFLKFKTLMRGLQTQDWELAAVGMIHSKWYVQVKSRAVELVKLMRTGGDHYA